MFSREAYFYPASSRYVLDNSYDAWAGAGVNWLLKDYLLFHLAGADAFYNEQGADIFWKPGGGVAGDSFPVQLSPKGKVAEAIQKIASTHPRGTQYTPIAFLLDEAHGWSQERFYPAPFGLDPQMNPAILTGGAHEASIRGWFDIAYYPAPETQNEPASAIRQTYVNGVFGDIFDVIVTSPKRAAILSSYPVVIAAGEISLTEEWGAALRNYVQKGGILVLCDRQLSGAGVKDLSLPQTGRPKEGTAFSWSNTGEATPSNTFRYSALPEAGNRILARADDGSPIAVMKTYGEGRIVFVGIPLGLGIDQRPVPLLGLLLEHLTQNLVPLSVKGDVEYVINRLDDGGWLVALLNNRGIYKPQHGILPTDYREAQTVSLRAQFSVSKSSEWITEGTEAWKNEAGHSSMSITVPAGVVRLIAVYPESRR
jgi:hypothetical protein